MSEHEHVRVRAPLAFLFIFTCYNIFYSKILKQNRHPPRAYAIASNTTFVSTVSYYYYTYIVKYAQFLLQFCVFCCCCVAISRGLACCFFSCFFVFVF